MKKIFKGLLWLFGGLLLLWVVAATVLYFYFTKERILALVLPKAEQALGRPVSVGDASFSAWGKIKINLSSVKVKNRTGFNDSLLFSAQKIALAVKILPLLKKQAEVTSLELVEPVISYEVSSSGKSNIADWFAATAGTEKTKGGGTVFLLVENLSLSNGQIRYRNDSTGTIFFLSRLNWNSKSAYHEGEKKLDFSGKLTSGLVRYRSPKQKFETEKLVPEISYNLDYSLVQDRMEVKSASFRFGEIALLASGEFSGLRGEKKGRLDIKSEEFSAAELKESFAAFLPAAAKEWKLSGKGRVAGQIRFASPLQGQLGLVVNSFELAAPRVKEKIRVEKLETKVDLGAKRLNLTTSNGYWGGEPFQVGLGLSDWEKQDINLDVKGKLNLAVLPGLLDMADTKLSGELTPDLSLSGSAKNKESFRLNGRLLVKDVEYSSPKSKYPISDLNADIGLSGKDISQLKLSLKAGNSDISVAGKVANAVAWAATKRKVPAAVTFTLRSEFLDLDQLFPPPERLPGGGVKVDTVPLPDWNGSGTVEVKKGVFNKLPFSNFRSPVKIDDGIIRMNGFTMDMLQGKVAGELTRNLTDFSRPKFDAKIQATGIEANELFSAVTPLKGTVFGKMNLSGNFSGAGLVASEIMRSMSANGNWNIDSGKLVRFGPVAKLGEKMGQDWKKELPLKNLKALFRMQDGKLIFNPLNFGLPLGDFKSTGSLGLNGALDFVVDSKITAEAAERFGLPPALLEMMKDAQGKIPVTFALTGTGADPKINLTLPGAREKKESLVEEKKEELKEKGSELLKRLKPK
ncbi:MAG: AsmA family protein [candidate division Zixibacteria bacterium]|nr:AsmA family protein [candidate division Zixibacteria bacterium]